MSLMLMGTLQQSDLIPATDAIPAKDGQEERKAQAAYVELAVFDRRVKAREQRMLYCKAPASMHKFFEAQLDEPVSLPVEGFMFTDYRNNAKVSYKLVESAYETVEEPAGK